MLPTVQAPPSGILPVEGGFSIVPRSLASLAEAQAEYDFPLLLPAAIPSGYQLGNISYSHPSTIQFDLLTICYVTADEHYLQIWQGAPIPTARPGAYDLTPGDEKGATMVQGREAYWWLGHMVGGGPQTDPRYLNLVWQPGPLRLTWSTDILVPPPPGAFIALPGGPPMPPPPLYVGYELQSDSLSLDDLVAIANSVQPYAQNPQPALAWAVLTPGDRQGKELTATADDGSLVRLQLDEMSVFDCRVDCYQGDVEGNLAPLSNADTICILYSPGLGAIRLGTVRKLWVDRYECRDFGRVTPPERACRAARGAGC
jgi:hypothetical protein